MIYGRRISSGKVVVFKLLLDRLGMWASSPFVGADGDSGIVTMVETPPVVESLHS